MIDTTKPTHEKAMQSSESQGAMAPKNKTNRKNTAGLLFGLGLAVVVAGLPSCSYFNKKDKSDKETETYQACTSIADYRDYMKTYGNSGKYYKEAKNTVDRYVADSITKAESRERSLRKAEAEERENEFYGNCTTIAGCDKYLKEYPHGKYVEEVKAKKKELEKAADDKAKKQEDEMYNKCTTIAACDAYLKAYPQGRYLSAVKKKKAELEKKEADKKKNTNPAKVKKVDTGDKKVKVKKN